MAGSDGLQISPEWFFIEALSAGRFGLLVISARSSESTFDKRELLFFQSETAQPGGKHFGLFDRIEKAQGKDFWPTDETLKYDIKGGGLTGEEEDAPAARGRL